MIAEGANLGVTQLGRVEYALKGGRINTDSVDNSAGVDCSDHEVNIKILLNAVEHDGQLTRAQRNRLLEKMTDEVAQLVLRDNYLQTGRLSITSFSERRLTDRLADFMRALERAGHLDRTIEHLPDDKTLAERKARDMGFTRPELCILLAYAKIALYRELVDSVFLDEPCMVDELEQYFPVPLRQSYRKWIAQHRLRREIIATMTTNEMVNRVGITFAYELQEKTGRKACDVARAYTVVSTVFGLRDLWADIDALDYRVTASVQAVMHDEASYLIEQATNWFLGHGSQPLDIARCIEDYGDGLRRITACLETMLADSDRQYFEGRTAGLVERGVPESLARRVAQLRLLVSACDIVRISREVPTDVLRTGPVYFGVGDHFDIDWLRREAAALPVDSRWDSQAMSAIVDDLYECQYLLTRKLMMQAEPTEGPVRNPRAVLRHAPSCLRGDFTTDQGHPARRHPQSRHAGRSQPPAALARHGVRRGQYQAEKRTRST